MANATNLKKKLANLAKTRGRNQNRTIKNIRNRARTLKLKTPPSPNEVREMERLANALKNFAGGASREPDCKLNPRDRVNTGFYCRKNGNCYVTVRECDSAMAVNGGRRRR